MSLVALAYEQGKHFWKVLHGFLYLSLAAQEILENLARQIDLESAFVVFVQQISVVLCEYFSLENYINNFTINSWLYLIYIYWYINDAKFLLTHANQTNL